MEDGVGEEESSVGVGRGEVPLIAWSQAATLGSYSWMACGWVHSPDDAFGRSSSDWTRRKEGEPQRCRSG